ncbi:MAG: tetratricopeptide repeat protein, partial [Candidatus Omnitrophota bacterium]
QKNLPEYALKLKGAYALIAPPEAAQKIAEDIRYQADLAFEKNNYKEADMLYKYYTDIAKKVYKGNEIADSIVSIADSYFNRNHFREALSYYEEYLDKYGAFEQGPYCTYKSGKCFYMGKNFPQAISQFKIVLDEHSKSEWFDKAYMALARIYYEMPKEEEAVKKLETLIKEYPERSIRDYAEILISVLYYAEEEYDIAMKRCQSIKKNYPGSIYIYAVDMLIEDMNDIKKNQDAPAYKFKSDDTYKRWSTYTPVDSKIIPKVDEASNTASRTKRAVLSVISLEESAFADEEESNSVKILSAIGQVMVLPEGAKTNWTKVTEGMLVKRRDRIKTGPSSSCDLAFDSESKNVVGIRENSDVIVLLDKQEKLDIIEAHIYSRLSAIPSGSSFEIKTPQAVCCARGTSLGVKANQKSVEASAYEDNISLKNAQGEEENVEQGFLRKIDQEGSISEAFEIPPTDTAEFHSWPVYITVKPGASISLVLDKIEDIDKFGEYLYDKEDESRLPKKIGDETTKDLLSISWESPDGGEFVNNKQSSKKSWKAPKKPGTYKITASIDDLGLTRPPDEGMRKDANSAKMTVIVIVKERG